MKVLFVRSGNNGLDPISQNQGESLFAEGCLVEYFDVVGKGIRGYLQNIPRLRRIIKIFQPDIIHAHYSLSGIIAFLCFPRKPIVCSLMGSDVNNIKPFFLILIKLLVKYAWATTIVKSISMKSKIDLEKLHVIPNGINLTTFRVIDPIEAKLLIGWNNSFHHILFGSDPSRPEKNFTLAKSAISLVDKELKDIQIHFLKNIPREEVYLHYNAADLLILTSMQEGSPNVIKEAMACNCPIVATDVGDIREIIGETQGCYVTDFNVTEIKNAILKVFSKNERTHGREKLAHLNSDFIARKIKDIYSKQLSEL